MQPSLCGRGERVKTVLPVPDALVLRSLLIWMNNGVSQIMLLSMTHAENHLEALEGSKPLTFVMIFPPWNDTIAVIKAKASKFLRQSFK